MKYWKCEKCNGKCCYGISYRPYPPSGCLHCNTTADYKPAWNWQIQIWITWVLCVITLIALWFGVGGCTKTAMKRIVRTELVQCCHLPSPVVTEYTAFTHYEFLMRSKMEGAEMVVDGDYRHLSIESREQRPDPNTIEAIGGAGGKLIKEVAPVLIRDPLYLKGNKAWRGGNKDWRDGV